MPTSPLPTSTLGSPAAVVDAVIVGAGPAGASTAISAAAAGLRVLVLTGSRPTADGRPGETLHPGVEPLFEHLGVADRVNAAGFVRHTGIRVAWDGPERFVAYGEDGDGDGDGDGPWRGYQAPGAELDELLLDRARELGVRTCAAAAVRPVLTHHGGGAGGARVTGVRTTADEVRAAFVVDAAGGAGWLARHLRLPWIRRSPPLLARFGYRTGCCPAHDHAPLLRAEGRGWTWIARVGPSRYAWVRVCLQGEPVPRNWVPGELRGLAPEGRTRGANVSWRALARATGPGWLAVGDAAARLDPASSHGVLRAVMSGMAAGHVMSAVLSGAGREQDRDQDQDRMLDGYATWMRNWFEHDVAELRALYRRHPNPPEWCTG